MTYVEEFRSKLSAKDCNKSLMLWQEYCENDVLDVDELIQILKLIKQSDLARPFGQYVEAILPLIMAVPDSQLQLDALCLVYDIQTSDSLPLYELITEILKSKFSNDPMFNEKLRLTGLRTKENFQGALSNFLLLNHFTKGNHVYHTAGWGVGVISDFSFIREQVAVRFENLGGCKRDISFKNAFKTLVPLPKDHFLALRFDAPEVLEKLADEDPVGLVSKVLADLGPKSAADLKELLNSQVIPQEGYTKWWQSTRTKLKKNRHIESPKTTKDCFVLRKAEVSQVERLNEALLGKETAGEILSALYSTVRDFPDVVKDQEAKAIILEKVGRLQHAQQLAAPDHLQLYFFLEQVNEYNEHGEAIKQLVQEITDFAPVLEKIEIVAMRKRLISAIRAILPHWSTVFLELLLVAEPTTLKDFILKELMSSGTNAQLIEVLETLLKDPAQHPEAFLWYFQKVTSDEAPLLDSQAEKERFFEGFFVLMSALEMRRGTGNHREFVKKMYSVLVADRFKIVRELLKTTDLVYAREFLLLASKCQTLSAHDQTILRSLVEVVHGGGGPSEKDRAWDLSVIWTTEEGYRKAKEQLQHMGTVEMVENAREIEAALAHGDLRENAEYKCALERRAHLQGQLKLLSDQFNRARIITPDDISTNVVSVGTKVYVREASGDATVFTILGPWDANAENHVLSVHSRLAQTLLGKKVGAGFEFRGEPASIEKIESYL